MRRVGRSQRRRAFTLLEIVLVLALIVAAAAFCWPAMQRSLARGQLLDSAKLVRTALARARLEAIESGRPQSFRYELAGRRYEVVPAADSPLAAATFALAEMAADVGESFDKFGAELPLGVRFVSPEEELPVDDPSAGGRTPAALELGAAEPPDVRWSAPIIFLPHGGTTSAAVHLGGEGGVRTVVWLRGLTGTATIDSPRREVQRP